MVGIPGKMVTSSKSAANNRHGINLDHHLISDPVGKAIECILDRIDALEISLQDQGLVASNFQALRFQACEIDNQICEQDCAGGANAGEAGSYEPAVNGEIRDEVSRQYVVV